jgi:hypothetical protein
VIAQRGGQVNDGEECLMTEVRGASRWVVGIDILRRGVVWKWISDVHWGVKMYSGSFEERFPTPAQRIFGGSSKKVDEGKKTQR